MSKQNLWRNYTKILNGVLQLSDRELDIFALLLQLNFDNKIENCTCTSNRRFIMRESRVNKNNLVKYFTVLKEKGIIIPMVDTTKGNKLDEKFIPQINDSKIEVIYELTIQ